MRRKPQKPGDTNKDQDVSGAERPGSKANYRLEALEPRILLSGDPILGELARTVMEDGSDNSLEEAAIVHQVDTVAEAEAVIQQDSNQAVAWPENWGNAVESASGESDSAELLESESAAPTDGSNTAESASSDQVAGVVGTLLIPLDDLTDFSSNDFFGSGALPELTGSEWQDPQIESINPVNKVEISTGSQGDSGSETTAGSTSIDRTGNNIEADSGVDSYALSADNLAESDSMIAAEPRVLLVNSEAGQGRAGSGFADSMPRQIGVIITGLRLQSEQRAARNQSLNPLNITNSSELPGIPTGRAETLFVSEIVATSLARGPPISEEIQLVNENTAAEIFQAGRFASYYIGADDGYFTAETSQFTGSDADMPRAPPGEDSLARAPPVGIDNSTQIGSAADSVNVESLTQSQLATVFETAIRAWSDYLEAAGLSSEALGSLNFQIVDLADDVLGYAEGNTIYLDADAAGKGWFVDSTPGDHSEFTVDDSGRLLAKRNGDAFGNVDLLTVLTHEVGHALGFDHDSGLAVMSETVAAGLRAVLPSSDFAIASLPGADSITAAANQAGSILTLGDELADVTVTLVDAGGDASLADFIVNGVTYFDVTEIVGSTTVTVTLESLLHENVWDLTGINSGTLTAGGLTSVTFSEVQRLEGGASADTFGFYGGLTFGGLSGGAGRITILIGDFVGITGFFDFTSGTATVDIGTGLSGNFTDLSSSITALLPASFTSFLGSLTDLSVIPDVSVNTQSFSATGVSIFVGINRPDDLASFDLNNPGAAVGLYATGVDVGFVRMTSEFEIGDSHAVFNALKANVASGDLVGVPGVTATVTNLEINFNNGSWPEAIANIPGMPAPAIDFVSSFPTDGGYIVPGSTILLDYSGGITAASAANITVDLGGFVYLSGSFAFEMGGLERVTVATGLGGNLTNIIDAAGGALDPLQTAFDELTAGASAAGLTVAPDLSTIGGLEMSTIRIGIGGAEAFVGLNGPASTNANAIGLAMTGVDFGMVLLAPTLGNLPGFSSIPPTFFALRAHADFAGLVGMDGVITATVEDIDINVNAGAWSTLNLGNPFIPAPVVDFAASFPVELLIFDSNGNGLLETGTATTPDADLPAAISAADGDGNGVVTEAELLDFYDTNGNGTTGTNGNGVLDITDDSALAAFTANDTNSDGVLDLEPLGMVIATGPSSSVVIDYATEIFRGAAGNVRLDVLGVIQLSGSLAFVKGPTQMVTLDDGTETEVLTMTIGADDVFGFIGFGSYWQDTNGDDRITSEDTPDPTAIGLAIENASVALAIMVDTNVLNPQAFVALDLNVPNVELVNVPGVEASGSLRVQANVGFEVGVVGFSVAFPFVDFAASFPDELDALDTDDSGFLDPGDASWGTIAAADGAGIDGIVDNIVTRDEMVAHFDGVLGDGDSVLEVFEDLLPVALAAADLDVDGKIDVLGLEVDTGNIPIYLGFTEFFVSAELTGSIDVLGIMSLDGVIGLEVTSTEITLDVVATTTLLSTSFTVDGTASILFGGTPEATGLVLDVVMEVASSPLVSIDFVPGFNLTASFRLALNTTNSIQDGAVAGTTLDPNSFLIHVDGNASLTLGGTTLFSFGAAGVIRIQAGSGLTAALVLTTTTASPDLGFNFGSGSSTEFRLVINTTGTTFDFDGNIGVVEGDVLFSVHVFGTMNLLGDTFVMTGAFSLEVTTSEFTIDVLASTTILGTSFTADGLASIRYDATNTLDRGLVLDIALTTSSTTPFSDVTLVPGFAMNATFRLALNTTGIIQDGAAAGTTLDPTSFLIHVDGTVALTLGGTPMFQFTVLGEIRIDPTGLAAALALTLDTSAPPGPDLGFDFGTTATAAEFRLVINTTGELQSFGGPVGDVAATTLFQLHVFGAMVLPGISITGSFGITVETTAFTIAVSASTSILGVSFTVDGLASIRYSDTNADDRGLVLDIALTTSSTTPLSDVTLVPGFTTNSAFRLALNTTGIIQDGAAAGTTLDPTSFLIHVDGTVALTLGGTPMFQFTVLGEIRIDPTGLAAALALTLDTSAPPGPDLGFDFGTTTATAAEFRLVINTTGQLQSFGGPVGDVAATTLFQLHVFGAMVLPGISITGSFGITVETTAFTIAVSASTSILGVSFTVDGLASIRYSDTNADDRGLVLDLALTTSSTTPLSEVTLVPGFTTNSAFRLALNTTDMEQPGATTPLAANSFLIHVDGTVALTLGGTPMFQFTVLGEIRIDPTGLAAALALTLDTSAPPGPDLGFDFGTTATAAEFRLVINTTGQLQSFGGPVGDVAATTLFQLHVFGAMVLPGISITGSFGITVETTAFTIAVSASTSILGVSFTVDGLASIRYSDTNADDRGLVLDIALTTSSTTPLSDVTLVPGFTTNSAFRLALNTTGIIQDGAAAGTTLDPTSFLIHVDGTVALTLGGTPMFQFTVLGEIRIDPTGLAAALALTLDTSAPPGPDLGFDFGTTTATAAEFRLVINTTGQLQSFGGPVGDVAATTLFQLHVFGAMVLPGISITGSFGITVETTAFTIAVSASTSILGVSFTVDGLASIRYSDTNADDRGLVLDLALTTSSTTPLSEVTLVPGFTTNSAFRLALNTTDMEQPGATTPLAANSFLIHVDGTVALTLGGTPMFQFTVLGEIRIDPTGLAAALALTLDTSAPPGPDLGFDFGTTATAAEFRLVINTTGQLQSFGGPVGDVAATTLFQLHVFGAMVLPGISITGSFGITVETTAFTIAVSASTSILGVSFTVDGLASIRYSDTNADDRGLVLDIALTAGANATPTVQLVPGFNLVAGFRLALNTTDMQQPGATATPLAANSFLIHVSGLVTMSLGGTEVFRLTGGGFIQITPAGLVASISLSSTTTAPGLGFSFGGSFRLDINTTSAPVGDIPVGFRLHIDGSMVMVGITLAGTFDLQVTPTKFSVAVLATTDVFGISLTVNGSAEIFYGSTAATRGLVLDLQLKAGTNPNVVVSPVTNFTISGIFHLRLNTTDGTKISLAGSSIARQTFEIEIGATVNLWGFLMAGTVIVNISSTGLSITIPDEDGKRLIFDLFGVARLEISGSLNTNGQFSFTAEAAISVGDLSSFGASGRIAVTITNGSFQGLVQARVVAFGQDLADLSGEIKVEGGAVKLKIDINVLLFPAININIDMPWPIPDIRINTPAVRLIVTAEWVIGRTTAPAAPPPVPEPPILASYVDATGNVIAGGTGGLLRLNLGTNVGSRDSNVPYPSVPNENYVLTLLSENTNGSQNIRVSALGFDVDYQNVTGIVVNDTQNLATYIEIANSITVPVSINWNANASGNNQFITGGGFALINGGTGSNTIDIGSGGGTYRVGAGSGTLHTVTDNSGGNLTVEAPGFTSYQLTDRALTYGSNTMIFGPIADPGDPPLAPTVERVVLRGAANATYDVSFEGEGAWTGDATFAGTSSDTSSRIRSSTSGDLTLTDTMLTTTVGTGVIHLSNIRIAELSGANTTATTDNEDNVFDVTGWTGSGQIGRITAQGGELGSDTIVAANDADFGLTDTSLTRSGHGDLTLTDIEIALLTGGAGENQFTVSDWTGTATLNGEAANDTFTVNLVGSGDGLTIINGGVASDSVTINGTAVNDVFAVGPIEVSRTNGSEVVRYATAESLTVNGNNAIDTFNVSNTHASTTTTLNGNFGNDVFVITDNSSSLTLNGGDDDDTFTLNDNHASLTVNGNDDNDVFVINDSHAALTINGGANDDQFTVNNINFATVINGDNDADTMTINATAANLTMNGGSDRGEFGDIFNIRALGAGTTATVNTGIGSGANVVNIGSNAPSFGGDVNNISANVFVINAQGTNDTVNVHDNDAGAQTMELTTNTLKGLGMAFGITFNNVEFMNINLGARADTINVRSTHTNTRTTINTGNTNANTVNIGSSAPSLVGGNVDSVDGYLIVNGESGNDTLNVDDTGDTSDNIGVLSSSRLTGLDMGADPYDAAKGIEYNDFELLNINLGSGNDNFTIQSTHNAAPTNLEARGGQDTINIRTISGVTRVNGDGSGSGDFDDVINVGSEAEASSLGRNFEGTLNGIQAALIIEGGGQMDVDRLNVDDSGDSLGGIGTLTDQMITGLGMHASGITYTGIEALHVTMGYGNDQFHVVSTHAGTTRISGGPGNDQISVDTIAGATEIEGDDPIIPIPETFDITSQNYVRVSRILDNQAAITLTLNGTTLVQGVDYTYDNGAKLITFIDSVGASMDRDGVVVVSYNGNSGAYIRAGPALPPSTTFDDLILVNVSLSADPTPIPTPTTVNGIGALLSIDGQQGSDDVIVYLSGNAHSTTHPISIIDVFDTGTSGDDNLDIYGSDSVEPDEGDRFLLRQNFVALIPQVFGSAVQTAERVNYNGNINGVLSVFGQGGDDYFALDDNSAVTELHGGAGNDMFQVGQMFSTERADPNILFNDDAFETVKTTRGYLSNGNSEVTTIYGDDGDDEFVVFHNTALLNLEGGNHNDTFTVRAFALFGSEAIDPNQKTTSIDGGLGADDVQYTANALVDIEGGEGEDSVVIVGTEFSDWFVVDANGVTLLDASGVPNNALTVVFSGVESLEIDGLEGNDRFDILATNAGVVVTVYGGLGSDVFNVGRDGNIDEILGTLRIEGGIDPDADRGLPTPLLYVDEIDPDTWVPPGNANFLAIEAEHTDILNVFNYNGAGGTGVLTDTRFTGFGMGAEIEYANLEMLRADLGLGADSLTIASTHAGRTTINSGPGNDDVSILTIGGATHVNTQGGNDVVNVGAAVPLGGETIDQISAFLMLNTGAGADQVNLDDSGDSNDNEYTLTGDTFDDVDLSAAFIQTLSIENASGGTFDIMIAGLSVTIGFESSAEDVKAALMLLLPDLPNVNDILVNRASNVFTIAFLGDEVLNGIDLTIATDASLLARETGAPLPVVNVTQWSNNVTQTIVLNVATGTQTVTVGADLIAFDITVGDSANAVRDALIDAIRSIATPIMSAEGFAVGIKDVIVEKVGDTYFIGYQGLLRGTIGSMFELNVEATTTLLQNGDASLTVNAVGGTFTLHHNGDRTYEMPWDVTAGELEAALNSMPGTAGVTVSQLGNVFTISGLVGTLTINDLSLDNPVVTSLRMIGINYYNVDNLNIQMSSGDDVVNVQGTTALTNIFGNGGDERFYISSLANEDLVSATTTDFLEGDLDDVLGELNIDAGVGRHILMISDESALVGDTNVVITDLPTTGLTGAEIQISGLAPGTVTFQTDVLTGNFADGITIWTGYGNDTITVDGSHVRAGMRTITTLNTGLGNDNVTVDLDTGEDGFFVLNTQGPYNDYATLSDVDTVRGAASSLPLIIFGGQDSDDIEGGSGADTIFGDRGQVIYLDDLGDPTAILGNGGPGDMTDGVIRDPDLIFTVDPTVGDNDIIVGNNDNDNVFGGFGGDTIDAGEGNNVVLGDHGSIEYQTGGDIQEIVTTDPNIGDGDTIISGSGFDLIIGGTAGDTITAGAGNDLIFGDHARLRALPGGAVDATDLPLSSDVSFEFTSIFDNNDKDGGDDTIFGEDGDDIILGQQGNDRIYGGNGNDDIIGGHNVEGGHDGNDRIDGGTGNDVIAGDNASIQRNGNSLNPLVRVLGDTVIYDLNGNANVTGASQTDPTGNESRTIVILDHSDSSALNTHGDDYIAGGANDDMIFGQLGNDTIQGDGSVVLNPLADDDVFANRDPLTNLLDVNASEEAGTDGDDYIEGGGGNDVIFGNLGQDDIIGGSSDLFGLAAETDRPDGSDFLFGGAGTDTARNDLGDAAVMGGVIVVDDNGHSEDSDMILGDNGRIFRLVDAVTGEFLEFNYDQDSSNETRGDERIIVRAAELLDYTPGGPDLNASALNDNGAADEIHGESGDDFIYGQVGNDILFGEGQDDDLIGGWGHDWMSGGTGIDGMLGDDGRIYTSRNEALVRNDPQPYSEPLYGILNVEEVDQVISTPGDIQSQLININGELNKTVNLTPFNVDGLNGLQDNLYDPSDSDDLMFGGWGNDFMHGGSGDDAMSGAEALPEYYDNPFNPGDLLGYGMNRAGEFAAYDEFNPLRHILVNEFGEHTTLADDPDAVEFILNFLADDPAGILGEVGPLVYSDGNDRMFGDLGNDWIVGGTGNDRMYGGRGDDLLNGDDDHGTNGGLNDTTDTDASYEDLAFGGAGRDILIANTGGDRLIDWAGEFNTYLVPFAPFGAFTISRALPPHLFQFLYDLSAADGADPTRFQDTGSGEERNGEPEGELGLVTQHDIDWSDQTGAPADVQPGNIPGGARDVLRGEDFNSSGGTNGTNSNGELTGFAADSGSWTITNGRLEVAPEQLGGDAVSLFFVDDLLPSYFEMRATINAGKPTGGLKSNAYFIFDYQSPTDFKFAGVDISTDKIVIGHRTAEGWIVDVQTPVQLKPNKDYQLLLSINGTSATLVVDNQEVFTFVFAARVDAYGYSYGLNAGMVGFGAFNSVARIDNVAVQILPPEITLEETEDFDDGVADRFDTDTLGNWQITGNAYEGAPATGSNIATSTIDLAIGANYLLELQTNVSTNGIAGFIFDQYSADDFKFVAISSATNEVLIGHSTRHGIEIDASFTLNNNAGPDYDLLITLVGTTVSVEVDGFVVLGYAFNAPVTDGAFGLFAMDGTATFDNTTLRTDDPAHLPAESGGAPGSSKLTFTGTPIATTETSVQTESIISQEIVPGDIQLTGARSVYQLLRMDVMETTSSWSVSDYQILSHGGFITPASFTPSFSVPNAAGSLSVENSGSEISPQASISLQSVMTLADGWASQGHYNVNLHWLSGIDSVAGSEINVSSETELRVQDKGLDSIDDLALRFDFSRFDTAMKKSPRHQLR